METEKEKKDKLASARKKLNEYKLNKGGGSRSNVTSPSLSQPADVPSFYNNINLPATTFNIFNPASENNNVSPVPYFVPSAAPQVADAGLGLELVHQNTNISQNSYVFQPEQPYDVENFSQGGQMPTETGTIALPTTAVESNLEVAADTGNSSKTDVELAPQTIMHFESPVSIPNSPEDTTTSAEVQNLWNSTENLEASSDNAFILQDTLQASVTPAPDPVTYAEASPSTPHEGGETTTFTNAVPNSGDRELTSELQRIEGIDEHLNPPLFTSSLFGNYSNENGSSIFNIAQPVQYEHENVQNTEPILFSPVGVSDIEKLEREQLGVNLHNEAEKVVQLFPASIEGVPEFSVQGSAVVSEPVKIAEKLNALEQSEGNDMAHTTNILNLSSGGYSLYDVNRITGSESVAEDPQAETSPVSGGNGVVQHMQSVQEAQELQIEELRRENAHLLIRQTELTARIEESERLAHEFKLEKDRVREEASTTSQALRARINALCEENQRIVKNSTDVGVDLRAKLEEKSKQLEEMQRAVIVVSQSKMEFAGRLDHELERVKELQNMLFEKDKIIGSLKSENADLKEKLKHDHQRDAVIHQLQDQSRHYQVQCETLQRELTIMKERLRVQHHIPGHPSGGNSKASTNANVNQSITNSQQQGSESCKHDIDEGHSGPTCGDEHNVDKLSDNQKVQVQSENDENASHKSTTHTQENIHQHEHDHNCRENHNHGTGSHTSEAHHHKDGHNHHHHEDGHSHHHHEDGHSHHHHDDEHSHHHHEDGHSHHHHDGSPESGNVVARTGQFDEMTELKKTLHRLEWENSSYRNEIDILAVDAKEKRTYEEKCSALQEENQKLKKEVQELEHVIIQLQGENDTIGDYITLYQTQKMALKECAKEKDAQLEQLAREREMLLHRLAELTALVKDLRESKSEAGSQCADDHVHCLDNTLHPPNNNKRQLEGKIRDLLTEISSSSLIENFHPCAVCSGRLMTV